MSYARVAMMSKSVSAHIGNAINTYVDPKTKKPPKEDIDALLKFLTCGLIYLAIYFLLKFMQVKTSFETVLFGIPVDISMLTGLMWGLFVVDGIIYIRKHQLGLPGSSYFLAAAVMAIVVGLSVVFHEMCHGAMAMLLGHPVDHAGISWWGAFVGWSGGDFESPMEQILISLAGPFSNLLIAFLAAIVVKIYDESLFENSLQYLSIANFRLGMFNLIPFYFPPHIALDGGNAMAGVIRLFTENPTIILWVAWFLFGVYWSYRKEFGKLLQKFEQLLAVI